MFPSAIYDLEVAVEKLLASERPVDVVQLSRVRNKLECAWLRAVSEYDRSEDWRAEGFVNAASALRVKCGLDQGVGHRALSVAAKLRELPVVSEAFAAGDLTRQHVEAITNAHTTERAPAIAQLEDALVDAARATTPKGLRELLDRVTGALDGDDGAALANARYERRRLHVSKTLDGMVAFDALLDPESGEIVINAIKTAEGRYRSEDVREPAQRRADALVDLCRVGAEHFDQGPGRERPNTDITAVIDVADVEERGGTDLADEIRAHRTDLPRATLRRIACDARIARVITDSPSQVIDVDGATRTIPSALWRALVARDGGCTTPGCDRPPQWCEVHHIKHWADGGETTLENTKLKCRHHHRAEHEGGHDPPAS